MEDYLIKNLVSICHEILSEIRRSDETFRDLIHFLRAQRLMQRRKQFQVNTKRIPYEPKKDRGLNANVVTKKFPIGKFSIPEKTRSVKFEN